MLFVKKFFHPIARYHNYLFPIVAFLLPLVCLPFLSDSQKNIATLFFLLFPWLDGFSLSDLEKSS
ncbi:putative inner membrane domain protein [Chlamydia psittaci WC]|nr:putative inner membrane domain protein [Chlamydia psittaci WC]